MKQHLGATAKTYRTTRKVGVRLPAIPRHEQKTVARMAHYSALVGPPAGEQLGVAVGAQESEHFCPVVSLVPVDVIEDQRQRLSIPRERLGVKRAPRIVAPVREAALLAPLAIGASDRCLTRLRWRVDEDALPPFLPTSTR